MKLYEIHDQIEFILANEVDEHGAITDETLAKLDELEIEANEKRLALAVYYKGELAEADAVDAEVKKLQARVKGHKARAARIFDYLRRNTPEEAEVRDARARIHFRGSPGRAVLVDEVWAKSKEEMLKNVDPRCIKVIPETIELDRAEALRLLRLGEPVMGFKLEKPKTMKVE